MGRSFAAVASWEPLSTFTTSGVVHHQPLGVAMEARFVQLSPSVEMGISTAEEPALASPTPRWEAAPLPFPLFPMGANAPPLRS